MPLRNRPAKASSRPGGRKPEAKTYDRAYFDRWYRDPRFSVVHTDVRARRAQLAVAAAEYVLERPIRTVLDVGCGEGAWRELLRHARPKVRYTGVDSSTYAIARYGRSRNLKLGTLGTLGRMKLRGPYDLIVCSDVLHYVGADEARRGLKTVARLLGGIAFLELFTGEDDTIGDSEEFQWRPARTYRRWMREAGLVHVGLHCWVGKTLRDDLITFEKAER